MHYWNGKRRVHALNLLTYKCRTARRLAHSDFNRMLPPASLITFARIFTLTDAAATERLTERLALVLRDPASYQAQYEEELAERGIEAALPPQELRDVALIDALLSEELLWEIDWKDDLTEMVPCLNELLTRQQRTEQLTEPGLARSRATGPEALDIMQELLEPVGLALVLLTLDSDSYPLSVVAEDQAEDARRLAQELGFQLAVY